jgi:hypothetical protein
MSIPQTKRNQVIASISGAGTPATPLPGETPPSPVPDALAKGEDSPASLFPPPHIIEAAESVRLWAEQNGYHGRWVLGGVCSRAYADAEWNRRELSEAAKAPFAKALPPSLPAATHRLLNAIKARQAGKRMLGMKFDAIDRELEEARRVVEEILALPPLALEYARTVSDDQTCEQHTVAAITTAAAELRKLQGFYDRIVARFGTDDVFGHVRRLEGEVEIARNDVRLSEGAYAMANANIAELKGQLKEADAKRESLAKSLLDTVTKGCEHAAKLNAELAVERGKVTFLESDLRLERAKVSAMRETINSGKFVYPGRVVATMDPGAPSGDTHTEVTMERDAAAVGGYRVVGVKRFTREPGPVPLVAPPAPANREPKVCDDVAPMTDAERTDWLHDFQFRSGFESQTPEGAAKWADGMLAERRKRSIRSAREDVKKDVAAPEPVGGTIPTGGG